MRSKTLIESWLHVELVEKKRTLAAVLKELNSTLGSNYTHVRVREWEKNKNGRGGRLSRSVRLYMAKKVIRKALGDAGIDVSRLHTKTLNKIVENLE